MGGKTSAVRSNILLIIHVKPRDNTDDKIMIAEDFSLDEPIKYLDKRIFTCSITKYDSQS